MQIGTMKPRKLEECGEPSFKWSQDFVNSLVHQANERPRVLKL